MSNYVKVVLQPKKVFAVSEIREGEKKTYVHA